MLHVIFVEWVDEKQEELLQKCPISDINSSTTVLFIFVYTRVIHLTVRYKYIRILHLFRIPTVIQSQLKRKTVDLKYDD